MLLGQKGLFDEKHGKIGWLRPQNCGLEDGTAESNDPPTWTPVLLGVADSFVAPAPFSRADE
jgi:hypothetical protein